VTAEGPRSRSNLGPDRPPLSGATGTVAIGFVGLVAALVVLGSLADAIRDREVFALDTWATPFLHSIASPGLDWFMNTFTALGSSLVVVPVVLVVAVGLAFRRRYGPALFLGVALTGAIAIDSTMKQVFDRPRPKLDYAAVLPDSSFPSGHSMNGVAVYVALAVVAWALLGRRAGVVALALALAIALGIGISRIYLGYHYLTDVVGGFLAGTIWLLVVGGAFRAWPRLWQWGREMPAGPGTAPR
jgi:undecaprenyl-diphosphatase